MNRLFSGGPARPKALLLACLAAPAALTLAVWLLGLAVGLQRDVDGPRVIGYIAGNAARVSALLTVAYGLPVFLVLGRLGKAGVASLLLAGAAPGVALVPYLASLGRELGLAGLIGGVIASSGAFAAGVFWLVARKADR